jgi:hypothetical protein
MIHVSTGLSLLVAYILGIMSNYSYDKIRLKFQKKKDEFLPEILDDVDSWKKSNDDIYFYEKDPNYNIKIHDGQDGLAERFKKFPDRDHDRISWVEVRFNELVLFGWNFIYLDGYRYFVPLPKTGFLSDELTEDSFYDYYDLNSMDVKVFRIIGEANLTGEASKVDGLKKIAEIIGVIVTEL